MSGDGVQVSGLSASHARRRVLHDVDVTVAHGGLLAVLGPSGCGKTTLLRCVAGLHRIDTGRITLDDATVADAPGVHLPAERRGVGLMPQEGALFPHLTVARNIAFGLRSSPRQRTLRPGSAATIRDRVREMAELAGVADLVDARPDQLSGGQQQRVALARALAPDPKVVLLDEPFAALDAGLRTALRGEVRAVLRAHGTTAVLVTHDQAEALSMADEVAVLLDGSLAQVGTPREVYERPVSRRVAEFVGEADFLPATRSGATASTVIGVVEVVGGVDGAGTVVLRPEQAAVTADADGDFVVASSAYTGPDAVITVEHRVADVVLRCRVAAAAPVVGTRVRVQALGPLAFLTD